MWFKNPPLSLQNPPPVHALFTTTNLLVSVVVVNVLITPLTLQILDFPNIEPEPVDEPIPIHLVLFLQHLLGIRRIGNPEKTFLYRIGPDEPAQILLLVQLPRFQHSLLLGFEHDDFAHVRIHPDGSSLTPKRIRQRGALRDQNVDVPGTV